MRIRVLFIFAFLILGLAAPARAYDPRYSKLIKYQQLMKLSPEMRAEYIRQTRLIVSEFEMAQRKFAGNSDDYADATDRNYILDLMINEAVAGTPAKTASAFLRSYEMAYSCSAPVMNKLPNISKNVRENGGRVLCLNSLFVRCPAGYNDQGGGLHKVCFQRGYQPSPNARAAAQAQRAANQKKVAAAKLASRPRPRVARETAPASRVRSGNAESTNRVASRSRSAERRRPAGNGPEASVVADPQDAEETSGDADSVGDGAGPGTTADDNVQHDRIRGALPPFEIANHAVLKLRSPIPEGAIDDHLCKDAITLDENPSCTDATVKAAREKYMRTNEPHCLFAGNLRHYANNRKVAGNCQPPHEFCLSNVYCRDHDGKLINENEKPVVKCSDSKKMLCNPMIFDLGDNDEGLCIPPTKNATFECNRLAEEQKAKQGDKYIPFVARVKLTKGSYAIEAAAGLAGIQETWNSFAGELNKICDEEPSKDLYCVECGIMKKRIMQLNLIAFKKSNTAANGNCYEFAPMDDEFTGSANSSTTTRPAGNAETHP